VLGADVVVLEGTRLVLCENDDLAGSFGEAFEHSLLPSPADPAEWLEAPIVAK
jgi:hypothetical protein